ncbi:hypothetical protein [Spirillospora sp. CA-294931]|uniref:hypothetical protein n=1 Tax=Spirillospora sp. CA-294931 TaxID=3240042 RepID=UPI003D902A5C
MRRRVVRALVIWFGLFQAVHTIFGAHYVIVERRFMFARSDGVPFPEPAGGWQPQAVDVIAAMGAVDLVISVLSVGFAIGYLRGARWSRWLGIVCLTVSVYAGVVFNWGTMASGAWKGGSNLTGYLVINIPWLPIVALFALIPVLDRWSAQSDRAVGGAVTPGERPAGAG